MKKITLSLTCLLSSMAMMAQSPTFAFIDAQGNEVPDGTVVTFTHTEEEEDFETGEISLIMPTGLSVKNLSQARSAMRLNVEVESIDNGYYQLCFPINCQSFSSPTTFQTAPDALAAGELRNLLTEWLPEADGVCNVKLQIEHLNETGTFPNTHYTLLAYGPAITLHFNNGDVKEFISGDVDGSGLVDVDDVNATINIILQANRPSDYAGNADLDNNGLVDVDDVNAIINKILKL